MANIIDLIAFNLPPKLDELTENNFLRYIEWMDSKVTLTKKINDKVEEGFKAQTGYTDNNRPKDKTENPITLGEMEFTVITELTTKRPSYSEIILEFGKYLNFINDQYNNKIPRKGVRTINEEPYVGCSELIDKLETDVKTILEGRDGIKQTVEITKTTSIETPETISYVFGRDYSTITEYNSELYIQLNNFIEEGDKRVAPFKGLLLQESAKTIGETVENIKKSNEIYSISYPFEQFVFYHQLEPKLNPDYKGMILAFIKGAPDKLTKRSQIGDLVKSKMIAESNLGDALKKKGLIDDSFMKDYNPSIRDGETFIRLEGAISRLKNYKKTKNHPPKLEQNLSYKLIQLNL